MNLQRAIVLVLRFTYRANLEEYSIKFHFNGAQPASEAGWKTIADEVWAAIKPGFLTSTSLVRAYGYEDHNGWSPGDPYLSVATVDYVNEYGGAVPGTLAYPAGGVRSAGDQAALVRFPTSKRSTKGKPVYLYTYLHDILVQTVSAEAISGTSKTPLQTGFNKLADGSLVNFGKRTTPDAVPAGTPCVVKDYMTTRTLRRRGKRPPTSP